MNQATDLRGPSEPENFAAAPHLSDYWRVVTQRLWLVALIFAVTTASAIWAISRQTTLWQSRLSLQVTDPLSRARSLTGPMRVSGLSIYVDPIESQIQLLLSRRIAESVATQTGMRLRPRDRSTPRSDLFTDAHVADDAVSGWYQLRYARDGFSAVLIHENTGDTLAVADAGSVLDAGTIRFELREAPKEGRTYLLEVTATLAEVASEVRLGAIARESTDLIDVTLTHQDPLLTPAMLNAAASGLSSYGAELVRGQARNDLAFAESQLDSAQSQLRNSFEAIQRFKETEAFTNLSAEEQQLVRRREAALKELDELNEQERTLRTLVMEMEETGVEGVDIVAFLAGLPAGMNPQIQTIAEGIKNKKDDIQRLLTEERVTNDHPRVRALRTQLLDDEGGLRDAVDRHTETVVSRVGNIQTELGAIQAIRQRFPELENQFEELEIRRNIDQEMVQYLRSQLYQAQILAQGADGGFVNVVDVASLAFEVTPRGNFNLLMGALLGLVLGIGAAFFLEYLDRTVRTSADVETLLGVPVLGIIPRLRGGVASEGEDSPKVDLPLIVALDPLDTAAEAYRNLRMNLMFMSTEDDPIRTVLFSSPGPHEGKSTTALNFAVMLAQQGQRVLLIDADLRRPSLHRAMDLLREPGLTNLLVGDADSREAIRPNVLPNLDLLPSGPFPPNPSELLNSSTMKRRIGEFEEKYSHVIIDSPPILAVTDAALLGTHTDGIVIVLRSGQTEQRAAERAVEQITRVGVRVFGAVLNEVATGNTEESYYLQYYYGYHPQEETNWDRLRTGLSKARFW